MSLLIYYPGTRKSYLLKKSKSTDPWSVVKSWRGFVSGAYPVTELKKPF